MKGLLTRFYFRRALYRGDGPLFEKIYRGDDPWSLEEAAEKKRFEETNRIIREEFGRVPRILEIGSGEGHHSVFLQEYCDQLTGLEISAQAIKRARERCPKAHYLQGDLLGPPQFPQPEAKHDLVVACEVLYYLNDPARGVENLNQLGKRCLVSFYRSKETRRLEEIFKKIPFLRESVFTLAGREWHFLRWSAPQGPFQP